MTVAAVALVGVVALGAAAEPPSEPEPAPFTLVPLGIKGTLTYKLAVYPETSPNYPLNHIQTPRHDSGHNSSRKTTW